MKTIIALTSTIFNELRRDGIGYTVQRVFNHIPRKGMMKPDFAQIVPQEGDYIYSCTWDEWLAICSGKSRNSKKVVRYSVLASGTKVFHDKFPINGEYILEEIKVPLNATEFRINDDGTVSFR